MIIVGITGTIGSGKSTTASIIQCLGYSVFDADFWAKALITKKKYKNEILNSFKHQISKLYENKKINIELLGKHVFSDRNELKKLEDILHPAIYKKKADFIFKNALLRKKIIFLDIPLLYENESYLHCDYILHMVVNKKIRDHRVLQRNNMTKERYEFIIKKQIENIYKFNVKKIIYINSGIGKFYVRRIVKKFLIQIKKRKKNNIWKKINSRIFYEKNSFRYRNYRS